MYSECVLKNGWRCFAQLLFHTWYAGRGRLLGGYIYWWKVQKKKAQGYPWARKKDIASELFNVNPSCGTRFANCGSQIFLLTLIVSYV